MNIRHYLALAAAVSVSASMAYGQGTFGNLDFESAMLSALPPGQGNFGNVPANLAFPDWICYYGTNQVSLVSQNFPTAGSANISILGPDYNLTPIIEGSYSALLQSGGAGVQVPVSIIQTGIVPASSLSIQFKVLPSTGPIGFAVSMDGQELPVIALSSGANYNLFGADVSMFAGQSHDLRFSAISTALNPFNFVELDSIFFSIQAIPEPGTWPLILCGAAFFAFWRRRR